MATLLRNKPPVPALPKEPPLPDNPPEPPLDEIAKGLARLVATRHRGITRATKHPPLERTIKQAGALQHARKQERVQTEQVKTQRQAVQVQRAQATAKQLEPVAEAAKKSTAKPTGPQSRPQAQSHTEPQQEAPAPPQGPSAAPKTEATSRQQWSRKDKQNAANLIHEWERFADNSDLSESMRQEYQRKADNQRALFFPGGHVWKERWPAEPDDETRNPYDELERREAAAHRRNYGKGPGLYTPAQPRGFRRRAAPEKSTPPTEPQEPPIAPGEPEPTAQPPVRGRFETMIALLKAHQWGAFNRYAEGNEPPGVKRIQQRERLRERMAGAEGTARRANTPPSVAEKVAEMRATQDDPSLGYFSAAAAKIREEQEALEALERKKKEGK